MRTVLFSPIGTADPLTQLGDGPMLHIVRNYEPNEVVLFLSPGMARNQDTDGRYTKAIDLLCDFTGQARPEIRLVRSEREDVHRFDSYIEDFERELRAIAKRDKGAEILANASSGTPAMEQAIVALGAFGDIEMRLLQVTTPRHDTNRRHDREKQEEYDLDTLWELNPDNEPSGAGPRIDEVVAPNFKDRLIRQNIKALISGYDYRAALLLAEQDPRVSVQCLNMLRSARDRLNLDNGGRRNEADQIAEYLWMLEVKLKQGRWGDFVLGLTPAYTWTARRVLAKDGLPEERYLRQDDNRGVLDTAEVSEDRRLSTILARALNYCGPGKTPFLQNWMLESLVAEYCTPEHCRALDMIRSLENGSKTRNRLAHQITSVNKEQIERDGHVSFEQVMSALFELNGVRSGKYDELNRQIVSLL